MPLPFRITGLFLCQCTRKSVSTCEFSHLQHIYRDPFQIEIICYINILTLESMRPSKQITNSIKHLNIRQKNNFVDLFWWAKNIPVQYVRESRVVLFRMQRQAYNYVQLKVSLLFIEHIEYSVRVEISIVAACCMGFLCVCELILCRQTKQVEVKFGNADIERENHLFFGNFSVQR